MNDQETVVIFRRWKESGDIIALFPEIPSDINGWYCLSYERIGQHNGADYHGVVAATRPVTVEEAAQLAGELTRIGYRLQPLQRTSRRVHDARRSEARRLRAAPVQGDSTRSG